jgi:hypothetical protein
MLHPSTTAELVRQRRAALDAESRNQRPIRQLQPRARADPERGRLVPTARTVPPTSAPWWPAPPEDQPPLRVVSNVGCNANSVW